MTKLNKEAIKPWVEALRSGLYKQGKGELQSQDKTYCCLGVACDVSDLGFWRYQTDTTGEASPQLEYAIPNQEGDISILPNAVKDFYGLNSKNPWIIDQASLAGLNDSGKSFEYIASLIEQQYL